MKIFLIIFIFFLSFIAKFAIAETFICNVKSFSSDKYNPEIKIIIEYKKKETFLKDFRFYDLLNNKDMTFEFFGSGTLLTKGIGSIRILQKDYEEKKFTFIISQFWKKAEKKPYLDYAIGEDLIGFFLSRHAMSVNTLIIKYNADIDKNEIFMFKSIRDGSSPFQKGLCEVF